METYTVKLKDPCVYYLEVSAETFPEMKEKLKERIEEGDYDDLAVEPIEIVEIRHGSLEETFPEDITPSKPEDVTHKSGMSKGALRILALSDQVTHLKK